MQTPVERCLRTPKNREKIQSALHASSLFRLIQHFVSLEKQLESLGMRYNPEGYGARTLSSPPISIFLKSQSGLMMDV